MKYDYIIVGAGLSGLTSAIILAKQNLKVLVLEQHNKAGGYLHSFHRKGHRFETGFHFVPELQDNQILTMYWKYLGILDKIEIVPYNADNFHTLYFPDHKIPLKSGFDNLKTELHSLFPSEKNTIDTFIAKMIEIKSYFKYFNIDHSGDMDKEHASFNISITDYLSNIGASEKLKAVFLAHSFLYGVPPEKTPLGTHAIFFNALYSSSSDIKGGGDALSNALVESLKENGGEILFNKKVTSLKQEDKIIQGVATEDEAFYQCSNIIYSTNPQSSFELFNEKPFRNTYIKRINDMQTTTSHFGGYFLTEKDLSNYKSDILYFPNYDINSIYNNAVSDDKDDTFLYLTVPTARIGKSKNDTHIIETLSIDKWDNYRKWESTKSFKRPEDYYDFKAKTLERVESQVQKIIPEVNDAISFKEGSTPLTNHHFTLSKNGACYGIEHNMEQMRSPIRARTKLPGFYYTGQSLIFPGIVGVTITGFVTLSEILGQDELFKIIDKEIYK